MFHGTRNIFRIAARKNYDYKEKRTGTQSKRSRFE